MADSLDNAPLMAQTYPLPRGPRVRLRLARGRDQASIRELLEHCWVDHHQLDVGGLVRSDPRERAVICATTLLDSGEALVGVGSMRVDGAQLELLCVDQRLTDGLGDLLIRALRGRVNAVSRPRAA
jgi:hypothetical protein